MSRISPSLKFWIAGRIKWLPGPTLVKCWKSTATPSPTPRGRSAFAYQPAWLAQVEQSYSKVQEFRDPLSGARPKTVLIFEAKQRQARRAQDESHS